MSWRLAKSLLKLREQINAAAPNRSKVSDGSVGDLSHAARASDHNPNSQGVVTAIDITHNPENGVDGKQLSRWLTVDARTKYVIFAGEIWKARTGKWEKYRGPNSHHHHVHLSVTPIGADDPKEWPLDVEPSQLPTLRRGDRGEAVKQLQMKLGIEADGMFGYGTEKAVKQFQKKHGLVVDGIVTPEVWANLSK